MTPVQVLASQVNPGDHVRSKGRVIAVENHTDKYGDKVHIFFSPSRRLVCRQDDVLSVFPNFY